MDRQTVSRGASGLECDERLSRDEETRLVRAWREHGDHSARERLLLANRRLVRYLANKHQGYHGLEAEDLYQAGEIGVLLALDRFDEQAGVRFATYASHWIRAEISEHLLRNHQMVTIATTKEQRKAFFGLRRARGPNLEWLSPSELDALSDEIGVGKDLLARMQSRLAHGEVSFDPVDTDDSDAPRGRTAAETVYDSMDDPASILEREEYQAYSERFLAEGACAMQEREQDVFRSRRTSEKRVTLRELGDRHRLTPERIRQIEAGSLRTMRRYAERTGLAGRLLDGLREA